MGIHQTRNDDAIARVDDPVGFARQLGGRSERFDCAVADEDRRIAQHAVRIVERLDVRGVPNQQRGHLGQPSMTRIEHLNACSADCTFVAEIGLRVRGVDRGSLDPRPRCARSPIARR